MRPLPIKTQKIIMWIPIANAVNFLIWGSNVKQMSSHEKKRGAVICFSTIGLFALLQLWLTLLIPQIEQISGRIVVYLVPVVLNWRLIRLQEQPQAKKNATPNKSVHSKRWVLFAVIGGCIIIAILVGTALLQSSAKQIADQNGANDTSLAVLTRNDILAGEDYTIFNHTRTASGCSSRMELRYDEVDMTVVSHKFEKISGVYVAHATKTDEQMLSLTITSTLQSGNMELAVVVDGEYHCSVPINQITQITLENIGGKTVFVMVAGESAKAEVSIRRSYIK